VKSTIRPRLQAGVSAVDRRAAAASLPPIDSLSMVDVLLGTGPSPRTSLPLGTEPRKSSLYPSGTTVNGLIEQDEQGKLWKLLTGPIWESGWTGPQFPNRSTHTQCFDHPKGPVTSPGSCIQDCGKGACLFELTSDPTEHANRAGEPALRPRIQAMLARIDTVKATAYLPRRCTCEDGYGGTNCAYFTDGTIYEECLDKRSCSAAAERGGFWGPFIE